MLSMQKLRPLLDKAILHTRANKVEVVAEFVAFLSMMALIYVMLQWYPSQATLQQLQSKIHIPNELYDLYVSNFKSLHSYSYYNFSKNLNVNPHISPIIIIICGFSAYFKRFYFILFVFLSSIFPWNYFGYNVFILVITNLSIIIIVYFYENIASGYNKAISLVILRIVFPFLLFFAVLISGFFLKMIPWIKEEQRTAYYVNSDSSSNKSKPLTSSSGRKTMSGGRLRELSELPVQTASQKAALAYVMAQQSALADNAPATAEWLRSADPRQFVVDEIIQERLATLQNYTILKGVSGEAARQALVQRHKQNSNFLTIIGVFCFSMALFLPFIVSYVTQRVRTRQIKTSKLELPNEYVPVKKSESKKPQRASAPVISSSISEDRDKEFVLVSDQLLKLFYAAVILTSVAAVSFICYKILVLPPADKNTAFNLISLREPKSFVPGEARSGYWLSRGVSMPKSNDELESIRTFTYNQITLFAVVLFLLLFKPLGKKLSKYKKFSFLSERFQLYGILTFFLIMICQMIAFQQNGSRSVSAPSISVKLRNELANFAGNPSEKNTPIDPSVAAYTLAQIAYIEGKASETAAFLDQIKDLSNFEEVVDIRRLQIMKEWVARQGIATKINPPQPQHIVSVSNLRLFGNIAIGVCIIAGVILLAVLAFMLERHRYRNKVKEKADSFAALYRRPR